MMYQHSHAADQIVREHPNQRHIITISTLTKHCSDSKQLNDQHDKTTNTINADDSWLQQKSYSVLTTYHYHMKARNPDSAQISHKLTHPVAKQKNKIHFAF